MLKLFYLSQLPSWVIFAQVPFDPKTLGEISVGGLVFILMALMLGWLVLGNTHRELKALYEALIIKFEQTIKDHKREVKELNDQHYAQMSALQGELLETYKTLLPLVTENNKIMEKYLPELPSRE